MPNDEAPNLTANRPHRRFNVFWFICRWWFTYGVFGGIAFVAGISPFITFCSDCRSNYEAIRSPIDLILMLMVVVGGGAIIDMIDSWFTRWYYSRSIHSVLGLLPDR